MLESQIWFEFELSLMFSELNSDFKNCYEKSSPFKQEDSKENVSLYCTAKM